MSAWISFYSTIYVGALLYIVTITREDNYRYLFDPLPLMLLLPFFPQRSELAVFLDLVLPASVSLCCSTGSTVHRFRSCTADKIREVHLQMYLSSGFCAATTANLELGPSLPSSNNVVSCVVGHCIVQLGLMRGLVSRIGGNR